MGDANRTDLGQPPVSPAPGRGPYLTVPDRPTAPVAPASRHAVAAWSMAHLEHQFDHGEKMTKDKPVHVVPRGDRWAVERDRSRRASSLHDTQAEAERAGRPLARADETEFFLHGRDGQIRERDSYGHDPNPPKDAR
jgi:hypothetical protein